MKVFIKKIIGDHLVYKTSQAIKRINPSKIQKEVYKKQQEEIQTRVNFYKFFVSKNDLCFDVGANFGNRIIPLLNIGAKVVAVEPQEKCAHALKKQFGRKIILVKKGLDEQDGVKEMNISSSHVLSSFSTEWIDSVKDNRFKDYNWVQKELIEMTTLDKLIEVYGVPHFIKIDVEGFELNVLKGLSHPIDMISIEYTVPEQTDTLIKCIKQIETLSSSIECNYSVGESMNFELEKWLRISDMLTHVNTDSFINTGFGDVYLRMKK